MSTKSTLPNDIPDLIKRLETASLEVSERETLQVLCRAVVQQLDSNSISKCAWEAARLSRFLPDDTYIQLLRIFTNCIASGTQDHTSLDPELLQCLIFIIRGGQGRNVSLHNSPLGSLLDTLKSRLETAKSYPNKQQRYDLICTVSATLDAMVDAGISGLSRETLHEPLLTILKGLNDDPELHLAQAASYAAQALHSVPNDDDPGDVIIRGFLRTVNIAMMITSGALNKDPQKLYEAAREVFKAGSDLKKHGWDRVKADTRRSWYMSLRVTEVLIRIEAFEELRGYVSRVACRAEKFFLCGLCAQLERYQKTFPGQQFQDVYNSLQTDIPRVQAWLHFSTSKLTQKQQASTDNDSPLTWKGRNGRQYEWGLTASPLMYQTKLQFNMITSQDLLNKACKSCPKVLRYYAKEALKQHYCNEGRLQIKRLSGETLPMEQCYINLAVVSASDNQEITLRDLFNPRKQKDGEIARPRQVFIEGQAGVGKTTLCKRMTYDFLYNSLWRDHFDWLIWLPLRKLKEQPSTSYNLKGLFAYQFFMDQFDQHRDLLADFMWNETENPAESNRVLFLLDGLDEITHFWDDETLMKQLLRRLMQGPQTVILTTRPYGTNMAETNNFEFRLSTIGFNLEQIESYVNAPEIIPEKKTAEQILSFIRSRPQIESVMRIPIQLDALCYTWNDSSQDGKTFQTMTAIYEAIVVSLLRKDAVKLGKVCNGRELNNSTVAELSTIEIYGLMSEEINLLEGLAFQGFYNGCIEFDKATRNHIQKYLKDRGDPLPQSHNHTLRSLSFVRTPNECQEEKDKQIFHFIHLTFQEYFAACYFVKYWSQKAEIPCIELRSDRNVASASTLPHILLNRQKYNIRYNILWRYVVGLLHTRSKRPSQQLGKFFEQLEAEPQDFLGPTHQRLLSKCLEEVPLAAASLSDFGYCKETLEKKVSWWLLFESKASIGKSELAGGLDYPEHLMYALFLRANLDIKLQMLSCLKKRSKVTDEILRLARLWVTKRDVDGQNFEELAFKLIARNDWGSRKKALDTIYDQTLKPIPITEIRTYLEAVAFLMSGMGSPPQTFLKMIMEWLQREEPEWRVAASSFLLLSGMPLASETAHSLILWLLHEDPVIKAYRTTTVNLQPVEVSTFFDAMGVTEEDSRIQAPNSLIVRLRCAKDTPPNDLKRFLKSNSLSSEYHVFKARKNVKRALRNQSHLPSNIQKLLICQLDDHDIVVRRSAADVLEALSNLSATSLRTLADRPKAVDLTVRRSLMQCFGHYPNMPQSVVRGLVEELKNQHYDLAIQARMALCRARPLSEEMLGEIVKMLSYEPSRLDAIMILYHHSPLPGDILSEIWKRCWDRDRYVCNTIFAWQTVLPLQITDALVSIVKDGNTSRQDKSDVIKLFENQSTLEPGVLEAMLMGIRDKTPEISAGAASVLSRHSNLPPSVIDVLVNCLYECHDFCTTQSAIYGLGKQQLSLPSTAIHGLLKCLDDQELSTAAAETLWKRSEAMFHVPKALLKSLNHANDQSRLHAAKVLGKNSRLPQKVLHAILDHIDDQESLVTRYVIEALNNQLTFSPDIIHRLSLRLSADDEEKSRQAVHLLHNRVEFYHWLPKLDWNHFKYFYRASLHWSFNSTYAIILRDKNLVIELPHAQKVIPIPSLRDRLKLRAYFALAQFLVFHGERREVRWIMEQFQNRARLAFALIFPIIIAMLLAYLLF